MITNRKYYINRLINWKTQPHRLPMVLWGARQVGKTHLMRNFASTEFKESVYLNFEKDKDLASLFSRSLDSHSIIRNLTLYFKKDIDPDHCLIMFDEVQECEDALNSLKYFAESGSNFHVIAAGSLLGVKFSKKGFPVGKVEFLDIYPCNFAEFLSMTGDERLAEYLSQVDTSSPIPDALHEQLLNRLREYTFVGGMPEVVTAFASEPLNFQLVRDVQERILRTYQLDFAKHAPAEEVVRIAEVFAKIPAQLAKENKKFIFAAISKSARARDYGKAITWLKNARILIEVQSISAVDIPLAAHADNSAFKIFLLDIGLLGCMLDAPTRMILSGEDLFQNYKGAMAENLVAQELTAYGCKSLYYWSSKGTAEVDFVVQLDGRPVPLEVKSGVNLRSKSLAVYGQKYACESLNRASLQNFKVNTPYVNYPLYALQRFYLRR